MSKRILVALLALAAISASDALASRARILVLGNGDPLGTVTGSTSGGSLSYDDSYNFFYNPVYVNDFKNWATIEKSNGTNTKAEGGFVTSFMGFNLGAYLNRVDAVRTTYANRNNMRPVELALGGDMGVKWGVGAAISTFRTGGNTDSNVNLKAGLSIADFEPFANWVVKGTEATTARTHRGYGAGVRYHFGEWTPYIAWNMDKVDDTKISNGYGVGVGRSAKLADNARLIYSTGYWHQTVGAAGGGGTSIIPIQVAVEGDAWTWLTLRGGLTYRLFNRTSGNSNNDDTSARLGAALHMGKADFEWAFGSANPVTAAEAGSMDTETFGLGSGLFTAASLSYHW